MPAAAAFSLARTSAVIASLYGARISTVAAISGIAPLITSISDFRPARKSNSTEGTASGICAPKSFTYCTGSSKLSAIDRAPATSNASVAQPEATFHIEGLAMDDAFGTAHDDDPATVGRIDRQGIGIRHGSCRSKESLVPVYHDTARSEQRKMALEPGRVVPATIDHISYHCTPINRVSRSIGGAVGEELPSWGYSRGDDGSIETESGHSGIATA